MLTAGIIAIVIVKKLHLVIDRKVNTGGKSQQNSLQVIVL